MEDTLNRHFFFTKYKNNSNNMQIEKININNRSSSTKNKTNNTKDNISENGNSLKNNIELMKNGLIVALEENEKVNNKY